MNARNLAASCDARPDLHDALLPIERKVLARWDAGDSRKAIAEALGIKEKTVKDVVSRYDDRPDYDAAGNRSAADDLAERNRLFVARIRAMQAHVALSAGDQ